MDMLSRKTTSNKVIIDSGATSNFATEDMNLPIKRKSHKEVYFPDKTKLQLSYKTEIAFKQLTRRAREADVLGLKMPLMSVNKMAEEGYTTIFHPGEEGVTVHKQGILTIAMTKPPILQGRKPKGAKLWTISAKSETNTEQANNSYNLPLISQTVKYHHTAAGFPVADTWIQAIKAGNYKTRPTITSSTVRRHFPESNKTQKGHTKKQRQGVQSARVLAETTDVTNVPALPKMKDICIKIHNATNMMHSNKTGRFPAILSRGEKIIMVLVEVNGNYIDAEPMKNELEGSMIKAYLVLWN
jgi:hypothetical protein